jgi:hypothetical protein
LQAPVASDTNFGARWQAIGRRDMNDQARAGWKEWILWVTATMAGVQLTLLITEFLTGYLIPSGHTGDAWVALLVFGVAAISTAVPQWVAIRRRTNNAAQWIIATLAGWSLVFVGLFISVRADIDRIGNKHPASLIAVGLLLTVLLSLPQWIFMRRRFSRAGYWFAARALGWLAGIGLLGAAIDANIVGFDFFTPAQILGRSAPDVLVWSVIGLLFGFGFATITGAALVWIQRTPKVGSAC